MGERVPSTTSRVPRTVGVLARLAYDHATRQGLRLDPLLKQAGLARQLIRDRAAPLMVRGQMAFVNLVSRALGDDRLGFHLAQHYDPRQLGWYYYSFASSHTLLEAFQRGARCGFLLNDGLAQKAMDGKEIGLRVRYAGISRYQDRHQIEFWLTSLLRMGRQLTGVRLAPSRVYLMHQRSHGASEISRFLGCEIKFGAAVDEVTFPGRLRDLPLLNVDPYLNQLLVAYCSEASSHRSRQRGSMRTRVENAIAPVLPHGNARAGHIAQRLGLSQRSLARHLAHEGLSFSKLLSELRLELARLYLMDEQLPVSHVAWLLGYQDVAAFSNAFKRWTGKAPTMMVQAFNYGAGVQAHVRRRK